MSQETLSWLNRFVLVGFTEKLKGWRDPVDPGESRYFDDGTAWHYREALQGAESNHYPGAIPLDDVIRRLFSWKVVEGSVDSTGTVMTEDGVETFTIHDENRKTMLRPPRALGPDDPGAILGVFKSGYKGHDYEEWLLKNVATILDDEIGIGSAALLKQGAQAFVSVEVPEHVKTPEGIVFKPRLLAVTSFDGSLSTTYKRVVTNAVCDNTMRAGLGEQGQVFKVKHSTNSLGRIDEVRRAVSVEFDTMTDAFAAEVAQLSDVKVSEGDWQKFLETIAPTTHTDGPKKGEKKTGRGLTMAENKRAALDNLWRNDVRVAPWAGSAWGVVQAVNTYTHHVETVKGAGESRTAAQKTDARAERNADKMVAGDFDKLDAEIAELLGGVLAAA